jgi:hypothetical protein
MKRVLLSGAVLLGLSSAALAQSTALTPVTTTVSAVAAATMAALPANPTRHAVTVCNGNATLFVTVTTGTVVPVSLTTGQVLQTGNVVASCFTFGNPGGTSFAGAAINVICSTAGPCPVTFFEYF